MRKVRQVAAAATISAMVAAVGIVTMPAANGGIPEETEPPAAYTMTHAALLVSCTLSFVDLGSGVVTPLGNGSAENCAVTELAVAPDGQVWGVAEPVEDQAELVHFDPATGARVSSVPFTGNFTIVDVVDGGIAFDAAGTLFAQLVTDEPGCDLDAVCLYTVDPATGASTFVGNPGGAHLETAMFALAANCAGDMVTSEFTDRSDSDGLADGDTGAAAVPFQQLAFVNPATGIVTDGPELDDNFFLAGLDYDRVSGVLFALGTFELLNETAADTSTTTAAAPEGAETQAEPDVQPQVFNAALYTVNTSTGDLTEVAPLAEELDVETLGIAGSCAAPEPAPIVLQPTFTG